MAEEFYAQTSGRFFQDALPPHHWIQVRVEPFSVFKKKTSVRRRFIQNDLRCDELLIKKIPALATC